LIQCSTLASVAEHITAIKIGNTGVARLVDSKRKLIAHGNLDKMTENLKDLSKDPIVLLGESNTPIISTVNGKRIVSYTLPTNLNWQLSIIQDYDDAYAVLNTIKINAAIASVFMLFALFFIAYLLGNSITKPIRKLANVAGTFSKGETLQDIPGTARKDEIGELARAIERLGEGMRVIVNRYQKLRKKTIER
jgi:methyl-accepting chemotaxis protein